MRLSFTDSNHAYYLDGKRSKSISAVAKMATDPYNLELYAKRMVAIGMTLDSTLIEQVAANIDNKEVINTVCEDAAKAAKANAKADRGSQRHRVLELTLLGRTDALITDQQKADAEVLARTLDAYGLEPIPHLVEQFVVYPDANIVGRFDAVLGHKGRPVLADLKSGVNAILYPHSTLTQLAGYRFAPHVSKCIERNGDKSVVEEWTVFPTDLDDEVAYVIHADTGMDVGELWQFDLCHGKAAADICFQLVEWRKRCGYGKEAVTRVDRTLLDTAKRVRANDPKPEPAPPALDEGGDADEGDVAVCRARYDVGMSDEQKAWTRDVIKAAREAGCDFRITVKATKRRADIYCGLTKLITSDYWGPQMDPILVALASLDHERPLGPQLGAMDAEAARLFRDKVDLLIDGLIALVADATGRLTVVEPTAA